MTPTEQTAGKRPTTNGHAPATAQTPKSKRIGSRNQRRAEIVIAALFLLTAAASIPAGFFLDPLLNASHYLAWVFPNKGAVTLDAVLWSINNIGIVFIAVFAFPVLRKLDEALAAGYLASRIIEGTIMMVGIMATLLLIPLSQEFLKAGAPQSSWFLAIGDVLKQAKFLGLSAVSLPMLGLGGSLFTWMLFRFRLVPRVISVVGLIGYALVFFGSIAGWFGLIDLTPGAQGGASLSFPSQRSRSSCSPSGCSSRASRHWKYPGTSSLRSERNAPRARRSLSWSPPGAECLLSDKGH